MSLPYLYCTLFFLIFFSGSASAQSTYVFFQNNTEQTLFIESFQSGGTTLNSSYWDAVDDTLVPWQLATEGLRVNRTTGITNGDDFYFDVLVHDGVDSVILQIKLTGNFIDSDMWHSGKGNGFDHSWHNDGTIYSENLSFGGKNCVLKYRSELNGLFDDVTFVIQDLEPYITPDESVNPNALTILTYNVFMLTPPISFSDQDTRAERMVHSVSEYDVVFLQETFDNTAREDYLIPQMETIYPYHTEVLDIPGTANEDGGVMIFSKYPIEQEIHYAYQNCYSYECLTNKGFMYAKVNKLGRPYHLIATHTQAFISEIEVTTRKAQIQEIRNFIDTSGIPMDEPVIVGGDMNVDFYENHYGEYDSMYIYLNALEPTFTGHLFTFQPDLNYYAESGPDELLDYLLPIADHVAPTSFFNETRILRQVHEDMWGSFDMSDHFAVYGRFEYPQDLSTHDYQSIQFTLYPNPSEDVITIRTKEEILGVFVYDLQGKVADVSELDNQLDLSNLSSGTYIIGVELSIGTYYSKLIKK